MFFNSRYYRQQYYALCDYCGHSELIATVHVATQSEEDRQIQDSLFFKLLVDRMKKSAFYQS